MCKYSWECLLSASRDEEQEIDFKDVGRMFARGCRGDEEKLGSCRVRKKQPRPSLNAGHILGGEDVCVSECGGLGGCRGVGMTMFVRPSRGQTAPKLGH